MSTIAERARLEADEAEAADPLAPDEEEAAAAEEEPEPEPEPEPEAASDALMEQIGRQLDQEGTRHTKAVAKIMGEQMGDLVPCPLCITPGFVTVEPPQDFDPDQRAAVLAAMGEGSEPTYSTSEVVEMCPDCDGWGKVLTGSKEPNFVTKGCDSCGSQGWRVKVGEQPQQWTPPPVPPVEGVNGSGPDAVGPPPIPWLDYSTTPPVWRIG